MKKGNLYTLALASLVSVSLLSGCLAKKETNNESIIFTDLPTKVAPSVQVEEKYYRGLTPFQPSETRGLLLGATTLQEYRLDADRLELGLLEIAQDYFPIDKNYFREGQLIDRKNLSDWLKIKSEKDKQGLNPEKAETRILRHILEHNYTDENGELKGVVIGLSLASSYQVTKDDKKSTLLYTADELRNYGIEMANEITNRLRKKVKDVPIIFAIYQLEERNSIVPGNFLSVGEVDKKSQSVDNWKTLNEFYLLFPSNALTEHDRELRKTFDTFRREVTEFFPNYVGIVGTGRFIDEKLAELTITVTTEFASKTEVIQLTQFLGGSAIESFDKNVHINIYVQTVNKTQAIFVRPVNGDPIMHVLR